MGLKLRAALLSCLAATAAYTGVKAYRSIVPAAETVPDLRQLINFDIEEENF